MVCSILILVPSVNHVPGQPTNCNMVPFSIDYAEGTGTGNPEDVVDDNDSTIYTVSGSTAK